jgi:hypothetical protein
MTEFMQSIPWFVPWLLFLLVLGWGTYKSSKLETSRRTCRRYYEQRNALAGELLRSVFLKERRAWVNKFPPVPKGFPPEYVEEISDFTEEELQFVMRIQEHYLDGECFLINKNNLASKPTAIRVPKDVCLIS